ncbi:MAG: hypothetical protein M3Y82_07090 [Verrucomicrobiota bacterium]|nr:hypothetical protein [Verrucomicrobiota bacterium]
MKLTSELLANGQIIQNPVGNEKGYWAGAPGVFFSANEKAWYLTYRIRRPHGVSPDRGGEARIARSTDLKKWEDIWSVTKDKYDSASIERSAIRKGLDGTWHYFTSYVEPTDGHWCVAAMKAHDPRNFDVTKRKIIFTAKPLGLEGIKDPWIFEERGTFYMILSIALPTKTTSDKSHSTLDIYNTGECVSATALATSHDLDNWEWQGVVFEPDATGWDCYCRRINSFIRINEKYFAFYDGSASHLENYEEKTGVAASMALRNWRALTPDRPAFTSPHASNSLRYLDVQIVNEEVYIFYEFARKDGAHDLRLLKINDLKMREESPNKSAFQTLEEWTNISWWLTPEAVQNFHDLIS